MGRCSNCGGFGHTRLTCPSRGGGGHGVVKKKKRNVYAYAPAGMIPVQEVDGTIGFRTSDEMYGAKVQCGCGGSHLPCGTAKGAASWRAHQNTQRHQAWEARAFYDYTYRC